MRIATTTMYQQAIDAINDRQAQMARSQQELATGRRLLRPSDDPGAAAQAERLRSQASRLELAQRMNDFARGMLGQAESTLAQVGELMQSLREHFLRAGNGTLGQADRASLAIQMEAGRDELLRLANRADGSGGHLFGGIGTRVAPFAASAAWVAVAGEQQVGLDEGVPTSLDGRALFMSVPSDTGPSSLFALLDGAIAVLEDPAASAAQVQSAVGDGLAAIDGGLDRVLEGRTRLGEQLRLLDAREALSEDAGLAIAERLSALVDTDYARSASDLARHQAVLQAALKTYASIGGLSLFDHL
jgi:flagellar hook-associated protein 3 FlgL